MHTQHKDWVWYFKISKIFRKLKLHDSILLRQQLWILLRRNGDVFITY